jgi:hypothetical protein
MKYLTTVALFLGLCSVCVGAGIEPSSDIEAKRDIKGYRPGMTLDAVKAKFPNWANCQVVTSPSFDPNRFILYGCPINPTKHSSDGPITRPYEILTFITSKAMSPETVLAVIYSWSSISGDPKALPKAILMGPSGNPLMAELDREIETIEKEFSVTESETCSPPQPAQPICIWWHLKDGSLLKFFYTLSQDDLSLALGTPPWLQERAKQSYDGTLPKKF